MKTLNFFIVYLEKRLNDTIKTAGGLELYLDPKYDEFKNRINEGEVVAAPLKYDTGVQVGDTLYFHHHVVINKGQPLTGNDNHYLVMYDPDVAVQSQAFAYKSKDSGEVRPLSSWSILEFVEEEDEVKSDTIELVKLKESPVRKGRVSFESPWVNKMGLTEGDTVGFVKNADYRFRLDDKEYYRTRLEDIMYKEL
jgi:co-chaperonin GroES (HSP10)